MASPDNRSTVTMIEENCWTISLAKRFFEKPAIFAAAYKFNRLATVHIEPEGEDRVRVTFSGIDTNVPGLTGQQLVDDFCRELNDQQLRQDLNHQFGKLRELIVEHAFKPVTNLKDRLDGKA